MSFLNPYIFREYDIRGKVEEDFPEHIVIKLGKAFGSFVKRSGGKEIGISGDIRLTTPNLITYFKTGVLKTGVDVIDPYSQGFAVPANSYTNGTNQYSSSVAAAPINVNGARYIFLAIA